MNAPARKTPLFKSLSDEALRIEYRGWRALAFNNASMASGGRVWRDRCANQMGRIMRNVEIIEAIARKRGISLAVKEFLEQYKTDVPDGPFEWSRLP